MLRGGVFLPYSQIPAGILLDDKNGKETHVMENQWGKVTLRRGLLCQTHINLIDKILLNAEKIVKNPKTNQIAVLYIGGRITRNQQWLETKLDDMMTTIIEIDAARFRIRGPLITEEAVSKVQIPGRRLPKPKGAHEGAPAFYRQILFSRAFSVIFGVDMGINYLQLAEKVLGLKHAETQALVRFCFTHDQVNMALIDLLTAIGAVNKGTHARTRQRVMKQIRNETEVLERDFGITIRNMEDGRDGVFYKKHSKVRFESPKPLPGPVLTGIDVGEPGQTVERHGLIPGATRFDTEIGAKRHGLIPSQEYSQEYSRGVEEPTPSWEGSVFS